MPRPRQATNSKHAIQDKCRWYIEDGNDFNGQVDLCIAGSCYPIQPYSSHRHNQYSHGDGSHNRNGIANKAFLTSIKARKIAGNKFISRQSDAVNAKLRRAIFFIRKITWSFFPWPIILLTMALLVLAKAQIKMPNTAKIFRMVLLIASLTFSMMFNQNIK